MRPRNYLFLKDVALLAVTTFGGPQAHLAMMFRLLVEKRNYLTEQELMELNALCQILPGPSSTQTITAIGFRLGGPNLAYLTLMIWLLPAALFMTGVAMVFSYLETQHISLSFMRFVQPMAVGFVGFAAYRISLKVVKTKLAIVLMIISAIASYFIDSPWAFPVLLLAGGLATTYRYKRQPYYADKRMHIQWSNFILWLAVLVVAAVLGGVTQLLPIRLFENFYRNGSLIFGGGHVLVPLLFTEFVEFKQYLSSEEFLSGFALAQALPGPVFTFCSYVGALSMREYGLGGQLLGSLMGTAGIFLPGTFLIFFVIRFWDGLRKYQIVQASLEGINAVSSGMVCAAAVLLYHPIENTPLNFGLVVATFAVLLFTKISPSWVIATGLVAGFVLPV